MQKIAVTLLVVLLAGCAAKPMGSDLVLQIPAQSAVTTFTDAVNGPRLAVSAKGVSSDLSARDKVFAFPGYLSYYKLFELNQASPRGLHIHAIGGCSCLGFDKRTLVPVVYALDSHGESLTISNLHYSVRGGVLVDLDVDVASGEAKYILVASNNADLDKTVGHINIQDMHGYSAMNLSVRSYPVGDFKLDYQSN